MNKLDRDIHTFDYLTERMDALIDEVEALCSWIIDYEKAHGIHSKAFDFHLHKLMTILGEMARPPRPELLEKLQLETKLQTEPKPTIFDTPIHPTPTLQSPKRNLI
jgi:hypothetical protein